VQVDVNWVARAGEEVYLAFYKGPSTLQHCHVTYLLSL
jgi:hypothetical protein